MDPQSGGLASLVHKASDQELLADGTGRALCQTVFFDGREHTMTEVGCQSQFDACSAELRVIGRIGDIRVTNTVTLYAGLDRVDFEVRLEKPATTNEQRLLHFFPVGKGVQDLRIETTAAVLRPAPQPQGDLLPGADTRRFAVQGFVDVSPAGRVGVTIALLDAYMLRLDQGALAFEAVGNDQNWKEVTQDQDGDQRFRFRYSLRAHPSGYDNAATVAWSRSAATPGIFVVGRLPAKMLDRPFLALDPARAVATCFKPSDDGVSGKAIVRIWETSGQSGEISLNASGYYTGKATDLLERELRSLNLKQGKALVPVRGFGFTGVALER